MNLLTSPTLPTNGTNEVQRLTLTGAPSGGTFKLRFGSAVMSGTLPYNASAAAVQTALRALPTIGSTGVTCSGGPLDSSPVDVTFGGRLGRMDVLPIQVVSSAFTGGTSPAVTVSTVTPGVLGTQRSAVHGQVLLYGTDIYINHGVPYAPDWQLYDPSGGAGLHRVYQHTFTGSDSSVVLPPPATGVQHRQFMFHSPNPGATCEFSLGGLQFGTFTTGQKAEVHGTFYFLGVADFTTLHVKSYGDGGFVSDSQTNWTSGISGWTLGIVIASDGTTPHAPPAGAIIEVWDYLIPT
jgi:hypothetical protein